MRDRFPLVMISGLFLLGVLGTFMLKGAQRGSFADHLSTYRSEPDGARALYLLAEQWKVPLAREQQNFETIDEKQNLVLLAIDLSEQSEAEEALESHNPFLSMLDGGMAPLKKVDDADDAGEEEDKANYRTLSVSAKERDQLLAHIRGGATVVYAPWGDHDNPLLEAVDVHLWKAERKLGLRTLEPSQPSPYTAGVERIETKVHAYLDIPAGSIPLLQDSELKEYVAAAVPYGQGQLIIIGAPELAEQRGPEAIADNAQFWRSTLRTVGKTGTVAFDEYHHGFTGERSIAEFAARYGVQFAIAQLILGVCLWAAALRRFGRAKPPPEDVRVGGTDALFATSRLYREGHHYGHAAKEIVKQLSGELAAIAGLSARAEPRDVAAALLHRGRADLATALGDTWTKAQFAGSDGDVLEIARRAAMARKLLVKPRKG